MFHSLICSMTIPDVVQKINQHTCEPLPSSDGILVCLVCLTPSNLLSVCLWNVSCLLLRSSIASVVSFWNSWCCLSSLFCCCSIFATLACSVCTFPAVVLIKFCKSWSWFHMIPCKSELRSTLHFSISYNYWPWSKTEAVMFMAYMYIGLLQLYIWASSLDYGTFRPP